MTSGQRSTGWFAAGALGGGLLVLAVWLYVFGADSLPWTDDAPAPSPARIAVAEAENVVAAASQAPPAAEEVISASSCPPQPAIAASASQQDGQFMLDAALDTRPLPTAGAFMTVAREAAQAGRVRDAEVALIAACRVAERQGGSYSAPVADVKSQLGEHYLRMAAQAGADEEQGRLLYQRATTLLSETADAYAAALGKNASRTRVAEKRLALVRSNDPQEAAAKLPPGFRTTPSTEMGAAAASADDAQRTDARRLISSDPELAQMDSDIGRLQAQASRVTDDPKGMQRRDAEAAAKREACQDRQCLLRWYAQRRSQLLNEF